MFFISIALYVAIQPAYTTKLANHLLKQYSSYPTYIREARFQLPNHLSLHYVEIDNLQEEPINIEQVDIWVNSDSILQAKPILDSLLINRVLLQNGLPQIPRFNNIELHQLAITNLDYSDGDFISRDTNIQIKNPYFPENDQQLPYGSIQFSAEQIYWQREAFNNVLVDIDYKAENSTVYGASFEWRGGEFSSQAEQFEQGWSLVNATVDQLRLNTRQWGEIDTTNWSFLLDEVYHINSLDVLRSTIETTNFGVTNGNLSIENLAVNHDIWQQNDGYISFGAESISYLNTLWLEPAFKSYFDNNLVSIEALSFEFEQGLIKAVGELTPSSAYFKNVSIDGIKWIYESPVNMHVITDYLAKLDSLIVDDFEIKRSQFIQVANKPNWQFSGLSLDGQHLVLMKKNKLGLWDGQIRVAANNASYRHLLTSQPLISMGSENGIWHLDEAFLPLEKGLIDATASYNLSQPSQPWRIEAFADGIPIDLFSHLFPFPLKTEAIAEFQLGLSGLGGDELMLRHSLTGQIVGSLRDSILLQYNDSNSTEFRSTPFESSEFSLSIDRGRIDLTPVTINGEAVHGQLQGNIDLVQPEQNSFLLQLTQGCTQHSYDFISHQIQEENNCTTKSTQSLDSESR